MIAGCATIAAVGPPMHAELPDRDDLPSLIRAPGAFDPWQAFNAGCAVMAASHADAAGVARRAAWRLRELLEAACAAPLQAARLRTAVGTAIGDPARSPRAAARAATLPLSAIEPIARARAMARFDEACTDRRITLRGAREFLAGPDRLGAAYLGRYAVWTSSGTTGEPAVWVHDARALAVYDALESLRLCGLDRPGTGSALLEDWARAPLTGGRRFAMVGATGGHFAGNASVERQRRLWPWAARNVRVFSILRPMPELRAGLEAFDPTVIATYPTAAEVLAAERVAGRLAIRPREIWLGGEHVSEGVRRTVAESFGCRVRQGYGASECLAIGWACDHGVLHLNADWVVLEPVDRALRPVPPGTPSHTVLLTNLANHVHPVIRHDLGDSVTMLGEPCGCGSAMPALRVEGRRDDVLTFDGDAGPVRLLPLALETVMEEHAGAFDFQLVGRDARTVALRLPRAAGRAARRAACHRALRAYLDANGLRRVSIVDDASPPARDRTSGKLRRVLRG
jgi:phenylacetate-CoA ligase